MNDKYKLTCHANPKTTTLERLYNDVREGRYIKFSYNNVHVTYEFLSTPEFSKTAFNEVLLIF